MSTRRKPDLPESLRETVLAMRRQARRMLVGFNLSTRRHQGRRDMSRSEVRRKAIEDDADGC